MTSKNNREHLPCPKKLCVSFHGHLIIWIGVTNQKCSNQSQIISFSPRVTLKFERWSWKTIGYLFYPTSSFVHHFVAIGVFKLELQSGNTRFGSKLETVDQWSTRIPPALTAKTQMTCVTLDLGPVALETVHDTSFLHGFYLCHIWI